MRLSTFHSKTWRAFCGSNSYTIWVFLKYFCEEYSLEILYPHLRCKISDRYRLVSTIYCRKSVTITCSTFFECLDVEHRPKRKLIYCCALGTQPVITRNSTKYNSYFSISASIAFPIWVTKFVVIWNWTETFKSS